MSNGLWVVNGMFFCVVYLNLRGSQSDRCVAEMHFSITSDLLLFFRPMTAGSCSA